MSKTCHLHLALGESEPCTETCPFWEHDGGCVFEEVRLHVDGNPALARDLLDLRTRLEQVRDEGDKAHVRHLFFHRLNEEQAAE
jgi:hypothetical protein